MFLRVTTEDKMDRLFNLESIRQIFPYKGTYLGLEFKDGEKVYCLNDFQDTVAALYDVEGPGVLNAAKRD